MNGPLGTPPLNVSGNSWQPLGCTKWRQPETPRPGSGSSQRHESTSDVCGRDSLSFGLRRKCTSSGEDSPVAIHRPGDSSRNRRRVERTHPISTLVRTAQLCGQLPAFDLPIGVLSLQSSSPVRSLGKTQAGTRKSYDLQLRLCQRLFQMGPSKWRKDFCRWRELAPGTILELAL